MTWEQLLAELQTMKANNPDVMDQDVCLLFDLDTIQYLELVYRLGSGELAFVASFKPENLSQSQTEE